MDIVERSATKKSKATTKNQYNHTKVKEDESKSNKGFSKGYCKIHPYLFTKNIVNHPLRPYDALQVSSQSSYRSNYMNSKVEGGKCEEM